MPIYSLSIIALLPVRALLFLSAVFAAWCLCALPAFAARTVELRDITVIPGHNSAVIQFLVTGRVGTVVIEPRGGGVAQVRMKSLKASPTALASALPKPGVRSVNAHIERVDVLVANVGFTREVTEMYVVSRTTEEVTVKVLLGNPVGTEAPAAAASNTSSETPDNGRGKWALSTIVIDAGHGGKDPGTVGLGGIREKDVVLPVSRMLRDELRQMMPGVKVVMTRDADEFVELYRRGQIANAYEGRLFISLHCNSMPTKPNPASGFECYILRPGRSEDAARVAEVENAAVRFESDQQKYEGMGTESAIMASMAQSAFARYSEELAGTIRSELRGETKIPDRGVHQAGFYVLVGASMPAVLVELGYLSNENDAAVLKSTRQQKKIARALARGIKKFEKVYSESLR